MPFKVKIGEDTHEITRDAIEVPDGYVLQTQSTLDATIEERLARQKSSLKSDDDFAKQVMADRGVPVADDGTYKAPDAADEDEIRKRLQTQLENSKVKPLKSELEAARKQNQKLLDTRLGAEIQSQALDKGIEDKWLKPISEGGPSMIENIVRPMVAHDDKNDMFAVVAGRTDDGDPHFKPATKQGKPWAGIGDLFEELKGDSSYKHLFKDTRPGSSGYEGPASSASGSVSRDDFESGKLGEGDLEKIAKGELQVK